MKVGKGGKVDIFCKIEHMLKIAFPTKDAMLLQEKCSVLHIRLQPLKGMSTILHNCSICFKTACPS